ncbi:Ada metal-binding domain-containing protein [Okibacterium endophyticum]
MAARELSFDERYRVIQARDPRFDGQFITAVRSTGIYCRPSCPARTPRPQNVTFYPTSAAAHEAGFRACKRCLPDAVPGTPRWNLSSDVASRAMRLISDGLIERDGVPGLASRLGYSTRHLTRLLTAELGAGPLALARANRAQTARTLLTSTDLAFSDIAFAAGFTSIRQFNDTVAEVFQLTPTELRHRQRRGGAPSRATERPGTISLQLPYRAPFDSAGVFAWLRPRAVTGVEWAEEARYTRTISLASGPAVFTVERGADAASQLRLTARLTALADLASLVARVRRLFDLDADPVAVDRALSAHPAVADSVAATPGIRLPGAVDPEEMLFRALIGQQVSVAAARTQLNRLTEAAGASLEGDDVTRLFPTAAQILEHGPAALVGPRARITTIMRVADALATGALQISWADDPDDQHLALTAFRGIGDWTAGYVSMRVLGSTDVLLTGDVALRAGARSLGLPDTPRELAAAVDELSPWRSYLSMHLWRAAGTAPPRPARQPVSRTHPSSASPKGSTS